MAAVPTHGGGGALGLAVARCYDRRARCFRLLRIECTCPSCWLGLGLGVMLVGGVGEQFGGAGARWGITWAGRCVPWALCASRELPSSQSGARRGASGQRTPCAALALTANDCELANASMSPASISAHRDAAIYMGLAAVHAAAARSSLRQARGQRPGTFRWARPLRRPTACRWRPAHRDHIALSHPLPRATARGHRHR